MNVYGVRATSDVEALHDLRLIIRENAYRFPVRGFQIILTTDIGQPCLAPRFHQFLKRRGDHFWKHLFIQHDSFFRTNGAPALQNCQWIMKTEQITIGGLPVFTSQQRNDTNQQKKQHSLHGYETLT